MLSQANHLPLLLTVICAMLQATWRYIVQIVLVYPLRWWNTTCLRRLSPSPPQLAYSGTLHPWTNWQFTWGRSCCLYTGQHSEKHRTNFLIPGSCKKTPKHFIRSSGDRQEISILSPTYITTYKSHHVTPANQLKFNTRHWTLQNCNLPCEGNKIKGGTMHCQGVLDERFPDDARIWSLCHTDRSTKSLLSSACGKTGKSHNL